MADLGTLLLGVRVNETDLESSLQDTRSTVQRVLGTVNKNSIKIPVDDSRLYDLNRHYLLKQKDHMATVQQIASNPIRLITDTRELDKSTVKVAYLNKQLQQIKSGSIGGKITVDQRYSYQNVGTRASNNIVKFDSGNLETKLDQVIQQLQENNKASGTNTQNIIKTIYRSSPKENILDKVLKIPGKIVDNAVNGFVQGIGQGLSLEFSKGISDYLEKKTGLGFYSMGKASTRYAYNRTKGFGEVASQALGYNDGLKGVNRDFKAAQRAVNDFLNPKKFVSQIKKFENTLVAALEDIAVYNNPEQARKRVGKYFEPSLEGVKEAGLRAGGVGLRAGMQPFRIRKRVLLAQSMELAKQLAEEIEVPELENKDAKTIALVSGGVDFQKGKNSFFAKNIVGGALGKGVEAVPVPNVYSNVETGETTKFRTQLMKRILQLLGKEIPKDFDKAIPLDKLISLAIESGFNPDAIKLEATRLAYQKKYPDKKFIFAGTSAGTVAAEEATAIAERGGATNTKGVGLTLGLAGLTNTASKKNFRAFVGNLDPLFLSMFGTGSVDESKLTAAQKKIYEETFKQSPLPKDAIKGLLRPNDTTDVVPGTGTAHHLGQFVADAEVQKRLKKFLRGYLLEGIKQAEQQQTKQKSFDSPLTRRMNRGNQPQTTQITTSEGLVGKEATAAFKVFADMYGKFDEINRTIGVLLKDPEAIKEVEQGQYAFVTSQGQLRKTFGESQERFDLEYATDEFEVSKRVKGVAGDKGRAFKVLMGDIVKALQDTENLNPAKLIELQNRFKSLFGVTAQYKSLDNFTQSLKKLLGTLPDDFDVESLLKKGYASQDFAYTKSFSQPTSEVTKKQITEAERAYREQYRSQRLQRARAGLAAPSANVEAEAMRRLILDQNKKLKPKIQQFKKLIEDNLIEEAAAIGKEIIEAIAEARSNIDTAVNQGLEDNLSRALKSTVTKTEQQFLPDYTKLENDRPPMAAIEGGNTEPSQQQQPRRKNWRDGLNQLKRIINPNAGTLNFDPDTLDNNQKLSLFGLDFLYEEIVKLFQNNATVKQAGSNVGSGVSSLKNKFGSIISNLNPKEFGNNAKQSAEEYYKAFKASLGNRVKKYLEEQGSFVPSEITGERPEAKIPIIGGPLAFFLDSLDNMKQMATFAPKVARLIGSIGDAALKNSRLISRFATSFLAFKFIGQPLTNLLLSITEPAIELTRRFETLEAQIKNFSGSSLAGQKNTQFIETQIEDLKLPYLQSFEGFAKLAGSTKGTQYQGDFTQEIFKTFSEQAVTRGLTGEDQQGIYTALSQMIGKGEKVSAEELIGQLAERLPTVVPAGARGLGLTPQELRAQLETGQVGLSQFLPALTSQLQAEAAIELPTALGTSQAKVNAFTASLQELQIKMGENILPWRNLGLEALTNVLKLVTDNVDLLTKSVGFLAAFFARKSLFNFAGLIVQMATVPGVINAVRASITSLVKAAIPMLRAMAVQFAASIAIFDVLKIGSMVFNDMSGEIRKFADQGVKNIEKFTESINKLTGGLEKLSKTSNETNLEKFTKGGSYLEETFIGGMLGKTGSRTVENLFTDGALVKNLFDLATGRERANTGYERQRRGDFNEAIQDNLTTRGINIGQVDSLNDPLSTNRRQLGSLLATQDQLGELQRLRNNLAPGDTEQRIDLDAQIQTLLQQQKTQREPFSILQSSLAQDIEVYKSIQQSITDEMARPEITDDRAKELQEQYKKVTGQLEEAQKAQSDLNKALKDAIPSAKMLEKTFALLTNRLQDNNVQIQLAASKQQELVALNQLTRKATPGQSQYLNDLQQQLLLTEQIKNNNQAIVDIQKELQNVGITEALAAFELDTNINNLKPTDIEAALKERTAETPEREILESVALPQLRNLAQLQLDTQNLQTQIAQSRVQAQEQLKQSTREIAEYFKGIYRQSQEVALAAKQSGLEVQAIEAKNKLRAGLKGFGNRFFGEFIDNILQLTEKLFEPLQNKLDLEQSLQQYQNQYADNVTQGNQLGQNAYGGAQSFTPYQVITPQGGNVDSHDDLTPHHDYQQTELGEVRDFTLLQNDNSRVPVPSPVTGTVDYVGNDPSGYGNFVDIRTLAGELVRLAHFDSLAVTQGESVNAGQPLGMQGSTGGSTGDHVHIEGPPGVIAQYMTALNTGNFGNQQTQSNAPAVFNNVGSSLTNATTLPQNQLYQLATIANLEASSEQGRVDVAHNIFNRINDGNFGSNATEVIFAPGQYEPVSRYGLTPEGTSTREGAINSLVSAGYSVEQATQALDRTLQLFADPQANASAREHVGGRLYFKGVSMYGNMQSNDRLRNEGENFYHDEGESEAYMQDLAARGPQAIVGSGVSVPGGGVNTQGIQQGQNLAAQNLNTQTQSALELMAARDEQDALETEQLVQQINKSSRTRRESLSDEVLNQQRQQEDLLYESQVKTPEIEYQRQSTLNLRGFDDRTRDTSRTIRELTEGIEAAELIRERLVNNPLYADVLPQILPGIDEEIKVSKEKLAELEEIYNEERSVYETQQKFLDEQYQRQEKARRLQARQRLVSTDNQLLGVIAQSERYNGRGMQAITYEGIAQRQQIDLDFETQTNELENLLYQGEITNEEFEKMKSTLMQIRDISLSNLNEQLRVSQEELQRNSLGQLFNSKMAIGQEQLQTYSLYGVQNPDLERDLVIEQQNFSFQQQVDEINRAVEAGQLLAETATQIKANLEAVNQVKLNNIETQFSPYTQAATMASSAFQQLGVNLLTSSGTIQDVLKNIMNQFANFAMQLLANELFGMLLGGGGSLFGGGGAGKGVATASPSGGSVLASLFGGMGAGGQGMFGDTQAPSSTGSSLISTGISLLGSYFGGGFAEGGLIPELNKNKNKIPGSSPIGKALRREGSGGVIAVFNPKERVLSVEQNKLFEQGYSYSEIFGRDVPNFKEGSHRSSFSPDPGLVSKNYEINVPVSYNGSGSPSDSDKEEMAMMGERIRAAVQREIKNQVAPNGIIDKRIRGR